MSQADPDVPKLSGRRVVLRPLRPFDYEWLFPLATTGNGGRYWRFRGATPPAEEFPRAISHDVEVQMVVDRIDGRGPCGLVQLVNVNHRNGYGSMSVILRPDAYLEGWPMEGIGLFLSYVFMTWNLRKIYFESVEPSYESYRSTVGRLLVEEGVLRAHEFVDGKYVDYHILALYRETWADRHERVFSRFFNDQPVPPLGQDR